MKTMFFIVEGKKYRVKKSEMGFTVRVWEGTVIGGAWVKVERPLRFHIAALAGVKDETAIV